MSPAEKPLGTLGGAPETPSEERVRKAWEAVEKAREKEAALSGDVASKAAREAPGRAADMAAVEKKTMDEMGGNMVFRMTNIVSNPIRRKAIDDLTSEQIRVEFPSVENDLQEIQDTLLGLADVTKDEKATNKLLYAEQVSERGAEKEFAYTTRFDWAIGKIQLLQSLIDTTPHKDAIPIFKSVKHTLEQVIQVDKGRYQLYQWQQKPNETDQAVAQAGKMGLFLGASAGALLFGTVAIAGRLKGDNAKGVEYAALIAAGVAMLQSPKVRHALFEGKSEQLMSELNTVLNTDFMLRMMRKYSIQGPAWRTIAEDLMQPDQETKDLIALLKKRQNGINLDALKKSEKESDTEAAETIEDYLKGINADPDSQTHKAVRSMIERNEFVSFAATLRLARSQDVRTTVGDYIELGAHALRRDKRALDAFNDKI